jgi:uncharacterized protein YndB with AHSA1/START domain
MNDHGTLTAPDTIRFERLLPGPIERVWAHLVDPGKRALWLAAGPMTPTPGGEVELHFRNAELSRGDDPAPEKYRDYENSGEVFGQVVACEPPHLLAFTWSDMPGEPEAEDSEVRFELEPRGEQVLLTLTHMRHGPSGARIPGWKRSTRNGWGSKGDRKIGSGPAIARLRTLASRTKRGICFPRAPRGHP